VAFLSGFDLRLLNGVSLHEAVEFFLLSPSPAVIVEVDTARGDVCKQRLENVAPGG